jgi:hypothetical protein
MRRSSLRTYVNQEGNIFNIPEIGHDFGRSKGPKVSPFSGTCTHKTTEGLVEDLDFFVFNFDGKLEIHVDLGIRGASKIDDAGGGHGRIREGRFFVRASG